MKLKNLIASVLAFTMVVALPSNISSADEMQSGIEETNPYMAEVIHETAVIQATYNKAKNNTEKQKLVAEAMRNVDNAINSYNSLFSATVTEAQKKDNKNRVDALKFKKSILEELKNKTGKTWKQILVRLIPASIASFTFLSTWGLNRDKIDVTSKFLQEHPDIFSRTFKDTSKALVFSLTNNLTNNSNSNDYLFSLLNNLVGIIGGALVPVCLSLVYELIFK